ncbi:MAG: MFS transporter, partial [Candidatus Thermoplasmatota archaeon]|nr:MFS transporter [Candidatus Thermoplasmatota archaeon]MCL5254156.1 MFS transporter [Candidatus Thermoplasmatota archaeon]
MNKKAKTESEGEGTADPRDAGSPSPFRPLDESSVKKYHLKTILIAGMGFFTDAYDLFVIGVIVAMFGFFTPFPIPHSLFTFPLLGKTAVVSGIELISAAAIFGAAVGPFIFGRLGDLFGRKTVYGIEMIILVLGAIASSIAWSFISLVAFRLILGLGIGGDYPMSATIMSEYSNVKSRGKLIATVFAMQGFGLISGIVLGIGLLASFPTSLDLVWRLLLLAGAIPAISVYYFRRRMPETPRYTYLVKGNKEEAEKVISNLTGK